MVKVSLTNTDPQSFCRLNGLRAPLYNKERKVYTTITQGGMPIEISLKND